MPNNIAVSITADVTDLVAKRAVLSAELKAATSDLNAFARQAAATGMTDAIRSSMAASAASVAALRAQIRPLDAELKSLSATPATAFARMASGAQGAASAVGALRAGIAGIGLALLAREAEKLASGMADTAEQAAHAATTFGETTAQIQQLRGLAAGVGVPFESLTTAMQRADGALTRAREGTKQAAEAFRTIGVDIRAPVDNAKLLQETLAGLATVQDPVTRVGLAMQIFGRNIQEVAPLIGLTKEQLDEINRSIAAYGVVSDEAERSGLALAEATNTNKIAQQGLGNVMTRALAPVLTTVTQGMNGIIKGFIDSYNAGGIAHQMMSALAASIGALSYVVVGLGALFGIVFDGIKGAIAAFGDAWNATATFFVDKAKELEDQSVALGKVIYDSLTHNVLAAADDMRAGWAQMSADAAKTANDIAASAAKIRAAFMAGGGTEAGGIWSGANSFFASLENGPGKGPALPKGAAGGGAPDLGGGKKKKSGDKGQSTEWQDELRAAELAAVTLGKDTADDLEQVEIAFWQQKVDTAKKGSSDYKQALEQLEGAQLASAKRAGEEQRSIDQNNIETQLAVQKAGLAEQKAQVEANYDAGTIDAEQRRDLLKSLLRQEVQDEIDALEAKKQTYGDNVVAVAEATNQEKVLAASLAAQLAALDRDYTQAHTEEVAKRLEADRKAAEEQAKTWKEANSEILGAENTLVSDAMKGRLRLGAALEQIALETATKEIQADVRYFTERALMQAEGIAATESKEEGGLLVHLLAEQKKTAATGAGASQRAAIENTNFFTQIIAKLASLLGIHVATEGGKTAATTIGATARASAETTSAGITAGAQQTSAELQIAANAGVAGSGGVASMASAPFPLDLTAPAFGESMFAAAMSFGSFAKGVNVVPHDAIVQVHAGERIVPGADNAAMIDAMRGRGAGGGRGGGMHVTYAPQLMPSGKSFKQDLRDHESDLFSMLRRGVRSGALQF